MCFVFVFSVERECALRENNLFFYLILILIVLGFWGFFFIWNFFNDTKNLSLIKDAKIVSKI